MPNVLVLWTLCVATAPAQGSLAPYLQALSSAPGITAACTVNVIGGGRESYTIELAKPNRLRIENDVELVVADGKTIVRYFKKSKLFMSKPQTSAGLLEYLSNDALLCWKPFFDSQCFSGVIAKVSGTANRQGSQVKVLESALSESPKLVWTLSVGVQDNLPRQSAVDREDATAKSTTIANISSITPGQVDAARFTFTIPAGARETNEEELRFIDKVEGPAAPAGVGTIEVRLSGLPLRVHTYRPATYNKGLILLVIHGKHRNAAGYRDYIVPLAEKVGGLVIAPEFDAERWEGFLNGDVEKPSGVFQPESKWTFSRMAELVYVTRKNEGKLDIPLYMIGHSAGGQFINRLIALTDIGAVRYVSANPGGYCFPDPTVPYSQGLGKPLPSKYASEANLKRMLAMPLTVFIGTADTGSEDLPIGRYDMAQGANRYIRAQNYFKFGKDLAAKLRCPFNWTYIEVPGVAHNAKPMLSGPLTYKALFGEKGMP